MKRNQLRVILELYLLVVCGSILFLFVHVVLFVSACMWILKRILWSKYGALSAEMFPGRNLRWRNFPGWQVQKLWISRKLFSRMSPLLWRLRIFFFLIFFSRWTDLIDCRGDWEISHIKCISYFFRAKLDLNKLISCTFKSMRIDEKKKIVLSSFLIPFVRLLDRNSNTKKNWEKN